MNNIFDIRNVDRISLKNFDGEYNYFNPTCNGKDILYRQQIIHNDSVLLSNVVDDNNTMILSADEDENYIYYFSDDLDDVEFNQVAGKTWLYTSDGIGDYIIDYRD